MLSSFPSVIDEQCRKTFKMAELGIAFSIISIFSSTTAFITSTSSISRKFRDGGAEIKKQLNDIKVLCHLLDECEQTFNDYGTVPDSINRCLGLCVDRHRDLMEILNRLRLVQLESRGLAAMTSRFRIVFMEDERKVAYNAFRDSVLLLRDLSSE